MSRVRTLLRRPSVQGAFVVPILISVFGCNAMSGEKSVDQVFRDPKVVALIKAANKGEIAEMDSLVRQGADPNSVGNEGQTPLVWAIASNNKTGIQKLLELGADPNKKMTNDNSATWLAAGRDDPKMLELLLQHRGDPNTVGAHDTTALEIAARQSLSKNIDLLVKYGANVNFANAVGDSAATWAASLGRFDLVGHLLELGYSNNLGHLAAMVQARHVPKDSEAQRLKDRVIDMLRARGVQYPVQPAVTK
jgi:ankyrin repeat protein